LWKCFEPALEALPAWNVIVCSTSKEKFIQL